MAILSQEWKAIYSIVSWISLNIALSLLNKYLFQVQEFRFPILIIMSGTFFTFVGSCICIFAFKLKSIPINLIIDNWKLLFFMSVCHGLSTGFENISIVYISISLNQVIKATSPAGTIIASRFIEGKKYSTELWLSTLIIIIGVVMALLRNPEFNWFGFLCAVASTVLGVSQVVASGILLQKASIDVLVIAMITSLPALFTLIPGFVYLELASISHHIEDGNTGFILSILLIMGVLAFVYNLCHYWMIHYTSAHYSVLVGNMKVLLLVFISMLVFHTKLKAINYAGIGISLVGFCCYNYFRYTEIKNSKENEATHSFTKEVNKLLSVTDSKDSDEENAAL